MPKKGEKRKKKENGENFFRKRAAWFLSKFPSSEYSYSIFSPCKCFIIVSRNNIFSPANFTAFNIFLLWTGPLLTLSLYCEDKKRENIMGLYVNYFYAIFILYLFSNGESYTLKLGRISDIPVLEILTLLQKAKIKNVRKSIFAT